MWIWIVVIILFVMVLGLRMAMEKLISDISELSDEIDRLRGKLGSGIEEDLDDES